MKKVISTLILTLFVYHFGHSQEVTLTQIPRETVFMEVFSGIECFWMEGVELALNEIVSNGDPIIIVRHDYCLNTDGPFENANGIARFNYYSPSGDPAAVFNGTAIELGGGSNSKYDDYAIYFEPMINQMTSYKIRMNLKKINPMNFHASITLQKLDTLLANEPFTLQLALTIDRAKNIWYPYSEFEYYNAPQIGMFPDYSGTPVNFGAGNQLEFLIPVTIDSALLYNSYHLIAWLQKNNNRQVMQAISQPVQLCETPQDVELMSVMNIPDEICNGLINPNVVIRNNSTEPLHSVLVNIEANHTLVYQDRWYTNQFYNEKETLFLPSVSFTAEETNKITTYISEPNEEASQFSQNDTITITTNPAKATEMMVRVVLHTDENPEETTWNITDPSGNILFTGGPYSIPNSTYQYVIELPFHGCYQLNAIDSGGDGYNMFIYAQYWASTQWLWLGSLQSGFYWESSLQFECSQVKPVAGFTSDVTEITKGESVHFYDNSSGDVEYRIWNFEGGSPNLSNNINPVVQYPDTGSFSVRLIVVNYPFRDTLFIDDYITVHEPAGNAESSVSTFNFPEESTNYDIDIFPNPVSNDGMLWINVNPNSVSSIELTEIVTQQNIRIEHVAVQPNTILVDCKKCNLIPGVYLLKLGLQRGEVFRKIVVK